MTIKRKIHCIMAKANRLHRPDIVEAYKKVAIVWRGDICEIDESEHAELQKLWSETRRPKTLKICRSCRGL